jgi:GTPase
LSVIAIVGAPNVGKSTFVNRVLGRRQAVVADEPGTTRDRSYNRAEWAGREFLLVDTGGMEPLARSGLEALVTLQARVAVEEADVIMHLADARLGVTEADAAIARELRRSGAKVVLTVNKLDNPADDSGRYPFYALGEGEPYAISASHGLGMGDLLDIVVSLLPEGDESEKEASLPRVAVIGRPNVGKSTLLNRLLGSERAGAPGGPRAFPITRRSRRKGRSGARMFRSCWWTGSRGWLAKISAWPGGSRRPVGRAASLSTNATSSLVSGCARSRTPSPPG